MSLRRAAAAAVLTTAVATSGLVAPIGSATAASAPQVSERAGQGCVTKAEYRKIKKGMTVAKVKRITGTKGKQVSSSPLPGGQVVVGRAYKACTSKRGGVGIAFVGQAGKPGTLKVGSKSAVWR
ncbi:hypothetical protein [Nocardioides litoris]|uniref:hypothetical protein n=1 Tax=Nocardioides litoris TaxID=1926648 RepID=UPI00111F063F|nr:hypothetical protein [Nocardioides litoris]